MESYGIRRYNSPTGMMEASPNGSFVSYSDHISVLESKPKIDIDLFVGMNEHYKSIANKIVNVLRSEGCIPLSSVFSTFSIVGYEPYATTFNMEDSSSDNIKIPKALMDAKDDSDIVVWARALKDENERKAADAQREANIKKEAEERAMLMTLLEKYGHDVK